MKKLNFKNTLDFERVFKKRDKEITDAIVNAIQEAMMFGKPSANLFEITFDEVDLMYEITLPKGEWKKALQSCLEHYEELEMSDECIDTWKLLEAVKVW